jgi:hypothetical protein
LYVPFLALIAIQALLIAFLPSKGPKKESLAADTGLSTSLSGTGDQAAGDAGAVDGATGGFSSGSGGSGATAAGGGAASGARGATGTAGAAAGSTAHCVGNKQFGIVAAGAPPCVPKFGGNNGGATAQGVTADKIKVIFFSSTPNDQVDAILATQGLAVPYPESVAFQKAALKFVEKHFELYGRKIDAEFVLGDCPTTPPDYDKCNAAAQEVVKKKPFMVVWGTPLYGSVFDIWKNAGIVSFGGWQFDDSLFNSRRPYRWDPFMNGTEIGAHIAEYYCKKMAKSNADHSGAVIHPSIGTRGNVGRKLGIVTPEIEANVLAAKRVIAAVKACGGQVTASPYTYESDIEKATQQTQATVSKLVQDKVTTVACMCDPIAPAFLTTGMTGNSYFPEFFIAGTQFIDADLVGRLYDKQQMRHAFGISSIGQQKPLKDADPTRVWRDVGAPADAAKDASQDHPCEDNGCGIQWAYVNLVGTALQMAGPNLNAATLERGLFTMPADGGWDAVHDPTRVLLKFGPNDYTSVSDAREIYWSATSPSTVDAQNGQCPSPDKCGAWISPNGGRRFTLNQWVGGLGEIPVEPN